MRKIKKRKKKKAVKINKTKTNFETHSIPILVMEFKRS